MTDSVTPTFEEATPLVAALDVGPTIQQIRNLIEEYPGHEVITITDPVSGVVALVVQGPNGITPISRHIFDDYLEAPRFRDGTAVLTKLDSLIDHVNRFRDEDSALFAVDDRKVPSITAVLNYHRAGADDDARFGNHRAQFNFPLSDEWKAWTEHDGPKNAFSMEEFAAFLEDRIIDVLELIPNEDTLSEDLQKFINLCGGTVATPNKLIELSRGLHVHESSNVTQVVNLGTGEGEISFSSEHTDRNGQALKVPGLFLIGIPVFKHDSLYRLAARLRYRKTPAGLIFWYELWRADRAFDNAFTLACERVKVETGLPLFFGKPE